MLAQLVIFRELAVLFYGSELFLGTFLSSWLFWVGSGSLLVRRLLIKEHPLAADFSYGFLAISLLFPALILLIRISKNVFAFGEFIGPVGTILYTFGVMSIFCFVIGGQFSLACGLAVEKIKKETALGRVYLYEALGAVIGGVAFTYLLIGFVPTFIIALGVSLGCILLSFSLSGKKRSLKSILLAAAALGILAVYFRAEPAVNRIEWKRYQFIKQKEARNATLSLVNLGSVKNIFVDGMLSASFPDPGSYEPVAHWPLLAAVDSARILVLGDVSIGVLKEALKHSPERVDYVVSDKSFVNWVEPYLDKEDFAALNDPAIHIHYVDSRAFVRNNEVKYDAVIINIPEDPNLKTNRFYSAEFYNQIRLILKPNGILGVSVVSSENYLSRQTRLFNAGVYFTLKSAFKAVEVIPGDSLMFLASPSMFELKKETILGRFRSRNISNHYVIPAYIEYKLETLRRVELRKLLETTPGVKINRDFRPTTCYYFADFWLNKFTSPLGYLAVGILFIIAALGIFKKRRAFFPCAGKREHLLIFVLGFVSILLELILLLGYQIISGYVYWQMGILFASFMSGVFLGAFSGNQFKNNSRQSYLISLAILSLIIITLAVAAAYFLPSLIYLPVAQNIFIFVLLLAIIGFIVGAAFVIAGFLVRADDLMAKAGSLYAADLWGAALGAILATNFIAPLFGILGALNFSAVIGAIGLAVFLILPGKTNP